MRKNIIFLAIVILIAALLYSLSTKKVVQIPADEKHANVVEEKMCLDCHAQGSESPLKKSHPPKEQCFKCHKRSKIKKLAHFT